LTREVRQLTSDPGRDGLATASPDGRYIAFVTDREGAWSVYVMRIDGGLPYKLFDLDPGYGRDDRDWRQERISWGF
jgi:Tol biopolymer transport system component